MPTEQGQQGREPPLPARSSLGAPGNASLGHRQEHSRIFPGEYINTPRFLSSAVADMNKHESHPAKLHPNTLWISQCTALCSARHQFAKSRLLQPLPCINSSSCVPDCHRTTLTLAALELQLLHFAVTPLQLLQSLREAAVQCGPEGWVFALISLLTSCLCHLLQEGSLHCETQVGAERRMQPQSAPGLLFGACFGLVCPFVWVFMGSISTDPVLWGITLYPISSYCKFPLVLSGYLSIRED